MNPKTSPYRRQLAQLSRLATAVPTGAPTLDPNAALSALVRLRSVLLVHVRLEQGLLYPWMLRRASGTVCAKVCRHRESMAALLASFLGFCTQWSTAASIVADPQGFARSWGAQRAALFATLTEERDDLYDIADGYAERRLVLAS